MLLYGQPGAGKTVFAASAPRPLILDTERGSKSLLNHPKLAGVDVLQVYTFKDLHDIFWELKDTESEFSKKYDSVIIDSISELQKVQLDELLDAAVEKNKNRSPYLPEWQEFNMNTNAMRRIVIAFRDLEKHLVITAHSIAEKDGMEGSMVYRTATTPKLATTLEGVMDIVGYMTLDKAKDGTYTRNIQVHPDRRVRAKTRVGLPPIVQNPSFNTLLSAYQKMILPPVTPVTPPTSPAPVESNGNTEQKGLNL